MILPLCATLVLAVLTVAHAATQLESRFASVDVDKILNNPKILSNYVNCVIDMGPCTSEGRDIKKLLPEVLATNCEKCSPGLRTNVKKTILAMKEKYPSEWASVVNKFDPNKTRAKDLETFLKS